ncbi:MAG: YebC/PmpR family DNA-binding transcriptional regulator [Oscillospiraceae bacterium]|nr:YebC/PmpR family DNA-binding transcriptional regulator [Oscillospiraceae bacterium]
MSGHSKWSTIKRKKEKTDGKRAAVFTKIGREMAVAIKEGGADPNTNSKLRDAIAKAKANNVPNDNIDRIIKKAAGDDKTNYEDIIYEGYGPNGIAVMVEALTDNRNRTAGDVRHYFDKFGGNLGQNGCVSFMFNRKGVIVMEVGDMTEDEFMEEALEAGVDDFTLEEGIVEVQTAVSDFGTVREYFEGRNFTFLSAELAYVPDNYTKLTDPEHIKKMNLLIDHLEENDDVQAVWHNWEEDEEE